jgi:hypothetical protein
VRQALDRQLAAQRSGHNDVALLVQQVAARELTPQSAVARLVYLSGRLDLA